MRLLKFILSISLIFSGAQAFAEGDVPPAARSWMENNCINKGERSCFISYGYHWLRKTEVVIDPALLAMTISSGVWTIGIVAKWVVGENVATQFLVVAGQTGFKIGAVVLVFGAAATVVTTVGSVGLFMLGPMMSSTAPRAKDQPFVQDEPSFACKDILKMLKPDATVEDFLKLTPEQMSVLAPCLPSDSAASKLFSDIGQQAVDLEKQIHQP